MGVAIFSSYYPKKKRLTMLQRKVFLTEILSHIHGVLNTFLVAFCVGSVGRLVGFPFLIGLTWVGLSFVGHLALPSLFRHVQHFHRQF